MKKTWAVVASIAFMLILAGTAIWHPVRFSAWRDGDHIMVEVFDVVLDLPPDRDTAGVFIKFPDKSIQFVPVSDKKINGKQNR